MVTNWTITKDYQADPEAKPRTNANAVGIVGPAVATMTSEEIANHPKAVRFKLYDDDNELYYEGFVVEGDEEDALLAPLDNFGSQRRLHDYEGLTE